MKEAKLHWFLQCWRTRQFRGLFCACFGILVVSVFLSALLFLYHWYDHRHPSALSVLLWACAPLYLGVLAVLVVRFISRLANRAESQLKAKEALWSAATMTTSDVMYEWFPNEDRIEWKGDLQRALGLDHSESLEAYQEWFRRVHPDDREAADKVLQEALERRVAFEVRYRIQHQDGSWRYWREVGMPIPNDDTLHIVGACTDVTDLEQSRRMLRDNERRLRRLLREAMGGIMVFEIVQDDKGLVTDFICVLANSAAERETRAVKGFFLGKSIRAIPGAEEAGLLTLFHAVASSGQSRQVEKTITIEGEQRWFDMAIFKLDDEIAVNLNDITEEKRQAEQSQLLQAQVLQLQRVETIGTLAGGIAHDFNNIIGGILGWTELARRHAQENVAALKDLEHVLSGAERAKDLVDQILAFSRKSDAHKKPVELAHCAREAVHLLRPTIPSNVVLEFEDSSGGLEVFADPGQLHQVIVNLCTNSAQALDPDAGGYIKLSLCPVGGVSNGNQEQPGAGLRLVIEDSGCGMSPKTLQRVFEPFFTTKPAGEGTGLGMAVVHGIISAHHGQIHIESKLGEGTKITIELPGYFAVDEPEEDVSIVQVRQGEESILFVDDESGLAQVSAKMLELLGYKVEFFTRPAAALERFRSSPGDFDLIITDQVMPGITGYQLIEAARTARPDIPAIITSGFNRTLTAHRLAELGNVELVLKPYSTSELTRPMDELCGEPAAALTG